MEIRKNWYKIISILGLALQLAKANFKLKNEGSFIGIFWYLLEPFLLFAIILGIQSTFWGGFKEGYPLYLLLGLIMFNFFSVTTGTVTGVIAGSSNLIKSIKINHESLIISKVLEGIISHFFEILLFIGFMIYFKSSLVWILIYPLIFGFFVLFVLGVSFILATLGVYIVDMNNAWRVITRLLFFLTPLFYVVEKGTLLYQISLFNPVFYFITIARELIINNSIPKYWMIEIAIGVSLISFVAGVFVFNRYKNKFAEMV